MAVPPRTRLRRACGTLAAFAVIATATALPAAADARTPSGRPARAHAAGSRILFRSHYPSSGDAAEIHGTGWEAAQVPTDSGRVEDDRIEFGPAPGAGDPDRPSGSVARFTLHPFRIDGRAGDETDTGGYVTNRVEVYGRIASRETPADRWPDPVGSTRWYSFSVYLPSDFPTATISAQWFDFVQWKGLNSGSPPVAMEIRGDEFVLGGANSHAPLGDIDPGTWSHFIVGLHFSDSRHTGWATVLRNGRRLVDHQPTQTMNTATVDGVTGVDPNYLKMGIYRSVTWRTTQTLDLSSMTIGTSFASVS
jgi:hypothetical protein